jgi:hypothetical protein
MANEFDELEIKEFSEEEEVLDEPIAFTAKPVSNDMISARKAGVAFDWNSAPDSVKAPPRKDLNGKVVTIKKADIILPPMDRIWQKTKAGDKEYKSCQLILFYDIDGQQENYSGTRVFRRDESVGKGETVTKYSMPTITRDRNNQASALLGKYADYKKKTIEEVSLKEFMAFLNGQPKAKLVTVEVMNPETKEKLKKNIVDTFVSN